MRAPRPPIRFSGARVALACATWVACVIVPSRADADGARDPVAAEGLFVEARRLVVQGRIAEACPKFEASQRLDPAVGTMLNLADCYERAGRVASAWAAFRDAEGEAHREGRAELEKVAHDHIAALEPRLPRVVIDAGRGAAGVRGAVVRRDGVDVDPSTFGQALPVDPGTHRVEVVKDGRVAWSTAADVRERERRVVVVDWQASVGATPATEPARDAGGPSSWSAMRWTGVGVAGAGVVAVGVGAVFALNAKSAWSDSRPHCRDDLCDPEGKRSADTALADAHAATIAFVVGGALVAGGAVLFFLGGDGADPSPRSGRAGLGVAAWPGGVVVGGRY